jgi:hypothetical protein
MVPGYSSVKLDIIAQKQCLGDNFNALRQRCAGLHVPPAPTRAPIALFPFP